MTCGAAVVTRYVITIQCDQMAGLPDAALYREQAADDAADILKYTKWNL